MTTTASSAYKNIPPELVPVEYMRWFGRSRSGKVVNRFYTPEEERLMYLEYWMEHISVTPTGAGLNLNQDFYITLKDVGVRVCYKRTKKGRKFKTFRASGVMVVENWRARLSLHYAGCGWQYGAADLIPLTTQYEYYGHR